MLAPEISRGGLAAPAGEAGHGGASALFAGLAARRVLLLRPGDWLTEAGNNSHAAAFNCVAWDKQNYSTILEPVCYPQFNGTVQAARELHAVQTEMLVKAKLPAVSDYVHSRAVEENYRSLWKTPRPRSRSSCRA